MRSIWVGLAVLFVLLASLRITFSASSGSRRPPRPSVEQADAPQQEVREEEDVVEGYGVSAATARVQALGRAQKRVQELLNERLGKHSWRLPEELIDPEYLIRSEVVRGLGDPVAGPQLDADRLLVVRYQVSLTPEYLSSVAHAARQQQRSDRHLLAVRVLAGLFGLLLVAAGYLRLEELTRGYATRMLRVGAAAVVALIGLGLWWSM